MAERLTIEHYIGEAFVKIAQVILGSRLFTASRGAHIRVQRDKKAGRWVSFAVATFKCYASKPSAFG